MLSRSGRIVAKALPLLLVVFLIASLLSSWGCGGGGEVLLTLTKGDQTATYTLKQLKAKPSVSGIASFMRSTGDILGEATYKGVELSVLAEDVGGLGAGEAAKMTATDEYSMTMTYDQIAADAFTTFDATGAEVTHGDLKVIVAYEKDGEAIDAASEGPLRLLIVAADGTLVTTEGHWWVKHLVKIDIEEAEVTWTLELIGAITENVTNNAFEAGAAPGCHGVTYTDENGDVWEGVALWRIIGRVDDDNPHGANAFNTSKAAAGYQVKITASDGFSKTLEITAIPKNDNPDTTWLLAYKLNGEVLPELTDSGKVLAPLKLVGNGLTSSQKVGGIVKIELLNLPS